VECTCRWWASFDRNDDGIVTSDEMDQMLDTLKNKDRHGRMDSVAKVAVFV